MRGVGMGFGLEMRSVWARIDALAGLLSEADLPLDRIVNGNPVTLQALDLIAGYWKSCTAH